MARTFPTARDKCHLDWDGRPVRLSISEAWTKSMLIYTIYLWTDGDGKDLHLWDDLKQIKAVYFSKKARFERANVRFAMPSPLELVQMAHQDPNGAAFKVVQNRNFKDETLEFLKTEYIFWQDAVKTARKA